MKYRYLLLISFLISFCLTFSPCTNSFVFAKDRTNSSEQSKKKIKKEKKKKRTSTAKSDKQEIDFSKQKKSDKKKSKSSDKKKKKYKSNRITPKAPSADSRDIWLARAKAGEILNGKASWYGKDFHGGPTASGLRYDMYTFTAAHRSLPLGTVVKVTDTSNNKDVMVCITDRGPYIRGRIIDLSYAAAQKLDINNRGVCNVNIEILSDEKGQPINGTQAFFIKYGTNKGQDKIGPFAAFADAAAMHEALLQAHPDAHVVIEEKAN